MTNIILDTNIILKRPSILDIQIPDIHFLIPYDASIKRSNLVKQRIEKAYSEGIISKINYDQPEFRKYRDVLKSKNISDPVISIIAIALVYIDKGETIKIASQNDEIKRISKDHNIEVLSENDISKLLK